MSFSIKTEKDKFVMWSGKETMSITAEWTIEGEHEAMGSVSDTDVLAHVCRESGRQHFFAIGKQRCRLASHDPALALCSVDEAKGEMS